MALYHARATMMFRDSGDDGGNSGVLFGTVHTAHQQHESAHRSPAVTQMPARYQGAGSPVAKLPKPLAWPEGRNERLRYRAAGPQRPGHPNGRHCANHHPTRGRAPFNSLQHGSFLAVLCRAGVSRCRPGGAINKHPVAQMPMRWGAIASSWGTIAQYLEEA